MTEKLYIKKPDGEFVLKTNTVTVYGASDDLVEVEGDFNEEWGCYDTKNNRVSFDCGTTLNVTYGGEGTWKITVVKQGADTTIKIVEATGPDDEYSDRATVTGPFTKVTFRRGMQG